ncbi:MAG: hypothetical protein J6D10_05380 [Clostridia bacterium]|nr:hypothetical protein [Clostridia bacterium]
MKDFIKLLLLPAVLLLFAGCTFIPEVSTEEEPETMEAPAEETAVPPAADIVTERYTLTEINLDIRPDSLLAEHFDERIYPLPSGDFVYAWDTKTVRRYYSHDTRQIPSRLTLLSPTIWEQEYPEDEEPHVRITMILGFDTGEVLQRRGNSLYLSGGEPRRITEKMFLGYPVYENRYFAIAAYEKDLEYFIDDMTWNFDIKPGTPKYALFRYEKRLTPYQYYDIYRTEDGYFLGVYSAYLTDVMDENGVVLRTETGDTSENYTLTENTVPIGPCTRMLDEVSGLYYYTDEDGVPLCEPLFNRATDMVNGRAVVAQWNTETNWNRLYMLELTE